MKKKQVLAVSSALMIGTTTALTGLPTPVMAQENTEVVQEAVVEENKTEQVPVEQKTENAEVQENITDKEQEETAENAETLKEESTKQETPATPEKEVVTEDKTVEASKNTEVKAGSIAIDEAHFPDKVFREQIIAEFDKDGDSVLSVDEISKAQFLNLHDMKTISSLEGIQYLTNLQSLDVSTTSVSDLSPVKNSSLKRLDCRSSKVRSVDLTRYPNLEAFVCDNTSINSLDVSKNEKLNTLFADSTSISNLDVTNNPNLEQLSCSNTGLMELDVTHNPQLVTLDIGDTKVKTLDISKNPNLKQLSCYMTNIAELDVTKNTKLTRLFCHDTPIKKLDLSNNLELEMLRCGEIFEQGIRGLDISKNTKIKKLICDDLYWLNVGENKVLENNHAFVGNGYIDIKGNKIDLKKDVEQGIDISKVKVTANGTLDKDTGIITVDDVKKPVTYEYDCGTYKDGNVVLKVELSLNSQGEDNTAPTISANDVTLNVGDTFDPLANVTATDKEDGTIILTKDNIIANDVDTSKAGTYHVTFRVVDKNGAITEKTITVTVKEKVTNKPVSPQQPQKPSKPTTPTKPSGQKNPVKTGDMTNVGLFTSMFAGSTGVLAVLLTTKFNSASGPALCLTAGCRGRFTFIGGRPFFILIFERKEIHMELNEMEKKLLFQVEGDYQTKILNELYMTVRYSNNSEQREAAEGLMAKLRVLSNAECMDLVKDIQKNYRLPYPARTIGEKIAESRQQSGAEKLKGHDIMALERFDPEVKHMIVFDVLSYDSPVGDKGDKMRLFLTDAGYQKFLESQERGEVKLKNHAEVSDGHLHYDRRDHAL